MRNSIWIILICLCVTISCHRKQPSDVIGESEMESLLYDFHMANAMAFQTDSVNFYKRYYFLEVLKKHGLTEDEFDKSLTWYCQHSGTLNKIYERINTRLGRESTALGVVTSNTHYYSSLTSTGDTANIWNGRAYYLLSPVGVNNRMSFSVDADSAFYPQDAYLLHLESKFMFTEGPRDAVVCLAVTYQNDSVQSVNSHLYSDGEFSLQLNSADKKIKRVSGFVYLKGEAGNGPKLLFITQPALIRSHAKKKDDVKVEVVSVGSASPRQNVEDTLQESPVMDRVADPTKRAKPVPLRKLGN